MSQTTRPISPTAFREAIQDLAIGSLHAKAAEIQNSITHLKDSNDAMLEFPEDPDLKEAIAENEEVMQRMKDRILMLRQEVERRGMRWVEDEGYREGDFKEPGEDVVMNGTSGEQDGVNGVNGSADVSSTSTTTTTTAAAASGRLTDEQLTRLLAERMGQPEADEEDEGIHL